MAEVDRPSLLSRVRADAAAGLALIALNLALYRKVVRLFWTWDDSGTLRTIIEHDFWAAFFDGSVWPQKLFTPLLLAHFDLGLAVCGLEARRFYALHLAITCAAAIAVYVAARSFIGRGPSFPAAVMFAAGVPLTAIVTQLSTAHYLIAIIFGALTAVSWHRALRTGSGHASILSSIWLFAALLAKEIAAPLPIIFVALPLRDVRTRVRATIPQFVVLAVYLIWRRLVLGTFGGGYGWTVEAHEWPGLALLLPWKLVTLSAGGPLILSTLLFGAMALTIAFGIRSRRGWMALLLALALSIGPFLPVAKEVSRRYAIAAWLVASIAFVVAAKRLERRRVTSALLVAVPVLTILANRQVWAEEFGLRLRMSDEAHFFFEMPPDSFMRNPASTAPQMNDLNWLRTIYLGRPPGGTCFYDDIFLCENDIRGKRVWHYEPAQRAVVEITSQIPETTRRYCSALDLTAPLSAHFWYRDPKLRWELGPYKEGSYFALIGNGLQRGELLPRNGLLLPGVDGVTIRLRYDSPDGWTTYSPELVLDFKTRRDFRWSR